LGRDRSLLLSFFLSFFLFEQWFAMIISLILLLNGHHYHEQYYCTIYSGTTFPSLNYGYRFVRDFWKIYNLFFLIWALHTLCSIKS
jgi:hypothetical protein